MNEFWTYTFYRAVRTVAQTAIATIGSAVVMSDVNWIMVLSASVLSGILSILMSIATGLPEVEPAIEATDEDMENVDVEPYDIEGYDDLYVDDDVDEGEDDEVE